MKYKRKMNPDAPINESVLIQMIIIGKSPRLIMVNDKTLLVAIFVNGNV